MVAMEPRDKKSERLTTAAIVAGVTALLVLGALYMEVFNAHS